MGSGKKFVPNGVFLRCSKGTMFPKFNVTPKRVLLYGEQMATELDIVPMLNIPSFGLCTVTKYCPPCMPIPTMWQGVCSDNIYVAFGRPLLEDSTMQCALSGKIEIMFTLPRFSSIASLLWNVSAIAQGIAEIAGEIEDAAGEIGDIAENVELGLKIASGVLAVAGVVCILTGVGAGAGVAMLAWSAHTYRASKVAGVIKKEARIVQNAAGKVRDVANRTSLVTKAAGDFAFDPSLKTGADLGISVLENVELPERKKKKKSKKLNTVDENQKKKSGGGTAGIVKNENEKVIFDVKSFKRKKKHCAKEFCRQLKMQEDGLNQFTVKEWLDNRQAYVNDKANKSTISNAARKKHRARAEKKLTALYERAGVASPQAEVDKKMKGRDALHRTDGVAGGRINKITRLGDAGVNRSLGGQWGSKTRQKNIQDFEAAAKNAAAKNPNAKVSINMGAAGCNSKPSSDNPCTKCKNTGICP